MISRASLLIFALLSASAVAEPVTYKILSYHTYPSFEADHGNGLSIWRGKFNITTGSIVLDRSAHAGTVELTVDMNSVNFGYAKMDEHARSADILDTAKYPTAVYKGKLTAFDSEDKPSKVEGELTLHGVTRPLTLTINRFMCKIHPILKKEECGADASATIDRTDYGIDYGVKEWNMQTWVRLSIQVEGLKAD